LQSLSGFVNGNYGYDPNGNMSHDGRVNVDIAYNFLNLPQSITGSQNLSYVYDATGRKLRKVSGNVTTDYINGIQYTNGSMDFVQTEEGRAIKSGSNWNYEYTLTDHLGNSRVNIDSYNGTARVTQEDEYYPFGLDRQRYTFGIKNKYLYNKKELQDELGQYDYGARFYDPVIGRWTSVDPLAEQMRRHSPYNYGFNNPMRFIDLDGMAPTDDITAKLNGTLEIHKTNDKFDRFFVENKQGNIEFVTKLDKNSKGLMQLPSSLSFNSSDESSSFSLNVKGGNEYRSFINGEAAGALFGAASQANVKDLTAVGFSLPDGSSPQPSTSHILGKNGDLRYLNIEQSGSQTLVNSKGLDVSRQSGLNSALHDFGWKDMVSERMGNGKLLPFTSSARERGIPTDHTTHLHLQGFRPRINYTP